MSARYATTARNDDGGTGWSRVDGGLAVRVDSPLREGALFDATTTNPEQLLALAWATCMNATAQALVPDGRRTSVRVEASLHDSAPGTGYEFRLDAYLSLQDAAPGEAEDLLGTVHARCPVSKLLRGASTVQVHIEAFVASSD